MTSVSSQEAPSTKAILSLVFGILAFFGLPCIGSILAIVLGKGERSGVGRAGYILGWVSAGLAVLGLIVVLFYFVLAAGVAATQ
jgi:hypothetical protein